MQRYIEIKELSEAYKDEEVCALYPNPAKNVAGKKTEDKMKEAEKDAKDGKCRLLVWRETGAGQSLMQPSVNKTKHKKIKINNRKVVNVMGLALLPEYHNMEKDGPPEKDGHYLIKVRISDRPEYDNIETCWREFKDGKFDKPYYSDPETDTIVGWWGN